jgi:DNA-directed RNA polymerase subunit H (RpoH/RPB5)
MHLLEKVYQSRLTLKDVLMSEWDTSVINDVSMKELEIMYNNQNDKSVGGSGCNFTLSNLKIPSHNLHVIYYNFPQLHLTGSKINKTCCDKLTAMYKQDGIDTGEDDDSLFDKEDSILIIINEPISENITGNIENMYHKGLEELSSGLNPIIENEMKENNFEMSKYYFRNVHIFFIDTLYRNHLNHELVPVHIPIRDKEEINQILLDTNSLIHQLPIILRTDPMAKLIRLCPGNICKIIRNSDKCGESIYYRVCK